MQPGKEFWDAQTARDELAFHRYFESSTVTTSARGLPACLSQASSQTLSAFGAMVWYLRALKLDRDLLSMQNFHRYDPMQHASSLILDGQTLINLEILENNIDGSEQGTLLRLLNRCVTPFGSTVMSASSALLIRL